MARFVGRGNADETPQRLLSGSRVMAGPHGDSALLPGPGAGAAVPRAPLGQGADRTARCGNRPFGKLLHVGPHGCTHVLRAAVGMHAGHPGMQVLSAECAEP